MKFLLVTTTILCFYWSALFSQNADQYKNSFLFAEKDFLVENTYYESKSFIVNNILDTSSKPIGFDVYFGAISKSNELATVVYNCKTQNKNGLLLAFYGNYWNEEGVSFKGYGFKNVDKFNAFALIDKIDSTITTYTKYLTDERGRRNIFFSYLDMNFILTANSNADSKDQIVIRVLWHGFDSEWSQGKFYSTKSTLSFIK